jgi:hypothetical protein
MPKGAFDVGGAPPEIDDSRIEWVVGYFQKTLPGFLKRYSPANQLVVHIDCDLYSSTLCCLTLTNEFIRKRSVSTVFLRQGGPVMLEEWELPEAQKS